MDKKRLTEILEKIPLKKIGVLGDFALDAYWHVDMAKAQLSRETPQYNRPIVKEEYSMGGASNVAWNLSVLGTGMVKAFSVAGEDWRAGILSELLRNAGIDTSSMIYSPGWNTVCFAKILLKANNISQEDARMDFVNTAAVSPEIENTLLENLQKSTIYKN